MFCPACHIANPANSETCVDCQTEVVYFRERVFIGSQFIFVDADVEHPIALQVDGNLQTYQQKTILARHQHRISFGDTSPTEQDTSPDFVTRVRNVLRPHPSRRIAPLPDQPRLSGPTLSLFTLVTDRKIYKPDTPASIFIVAPAGGNREVNLEVQLGGQKVYEDKLTLNAEGLGIHTFVDTKEGEYRLIATLGPPPDTHPSKIPPPQTAECTFSVAEFTLSPLIATLQSHTFEKQVLNFTIQIALLSIPYNGSVELGLQCKVCGDRVVETKTATVKDGVVTDSFKISGHGGPFHVQIITPDGNTAQVAFPGSGSRERNRIKVNSLGQTMSMGLLPWDKAEPLRGFYLGPDKIVNTPLMLDQVQAKQGRLNIASDIEKLQLITFNPQTGEREIIEKNNLNRDAYLEFEGLAPYTLFTVGAFLTKGEPFEGWGMLIKPVDFEATLSIPATAVPGEAIPVEITLTNEADNQPTPAYCWLLVYDVRLEHESPLPKLAKQIYESMRNSAGNLKANGVDNAHTFNWGPTDDFVGADATHSMGPLVRFAAPAGQGLLRAVSAALPPAEPMPTEEPTTVVEKVATATPTMVVAPTRMDFPEVAYQELFYLAGSGSRTVKLGDQIGTWRVRAYLWQGADYRELTQDIQADKPLYAELDLPAIASFGDNIIATANYNTHQPATLVISTPFGETRETVNGSGALHFPIQGPCRVEVRLENEASSDWSVRDVDPPGIQKVTASQLLLLDQGETVQGEKVLVYSSVGHVLKDTITALINYPFG